MKLALALLMLVSGFATADEISDRETRNQERAAAESRQRSLDYRAKGNAERLIAFNGFVDHHGGLRSGTCTVAAEDCSQRDRYSSYCPVRDSGQADIRSLGASGEYIVRDCRVHTGDNSACVLQSDWERSSGEKKVYKATCTPEGAAAYELTFGPNGREYKAAPIKPPKEEKETYTYDSRAYRNYYRRYGYYGYYGYPLYGSRVYNCYGEQCNYYVGGGKKKKAPRAR